MSLWSKSILIQLKGTWWQNTCINKPIIKHSTLRNTFLYYGQKCPKDNTKTMKLFCKPSKKSQKIIFWHLDK